MADGIRRGRRRFSRLLGSLNVRKEVKQSFREKEKQKYLINHVKCILLHFRQTNELKTAYRPMCPCHVTLTSRSREKESKLKVKKVQALFAPSKIVFVLQKKSVNRETFLVQTIFHLPNFFQLSPQVKAVVQELLVRSLLIDRRKQ